MQLSVIPKSTDNYFYNISQIKHEMEVIVRSVLYNIDVISLKKKKLNSIDLSHKLSEYSDEELEMRVHKINEDIFSRVDLSDYSRFKSKFVPLHILVDILKNYNNYELIRFKYKSNIIMFNYYYKEYDYISVLLKAIKIISFIEYCNFVDRQIHITFAGTEHKKKLPNIKKLGPRSINSGFTVHWFNGDIHMTVFRSEESDKVMLHELVHYLKLDFAMCDNSEINKMVLEDFNINKDDRFVNLFEAFTDFIAIIFNSIINCIFVKGNLNNYIQMEIDYVENQMNKILLHSGINHVKDLLDKSKNIFLEQYTSILSYYILKYFLMNSSDYVLRNFFPMSNTEWSQKDILELYNHIKNGISKYKKRINKQIINNDSLSMSLINLRY
tara:strand:+ start:1210 stop:2361 length:1152 start_codon:yes stop_codon:yes gene_type:complete